MPLARCFSARGELADLDELGWNRGGDPVDGVAQQVLLGVGGRPRTPDPQRIRGSSCGGSEIIDVNGGAYL